MSKQKNILKRSVLVAMLTALCCAATFIQIKMPAGDMVHLGNFVMILSALLLGGLEGGIVGSLGMGIYDLIYYSSKPTTIVRTLILKFIVGFIVGTLFRLFIKKDLNARKTLFILSGILLLIGVGSTIVFALGDFSSFGFNEGLSSIHYIAGKTVKISLYIPIFAILFGITSLVAAILSKKISKRSKAVLLAVIFAIFVNIIGEFLLRFLLEGLFTTGFEVSIVTATSKIPGSMITGFVSVLLTIFIYEPVYFALKKASIVEDLDSSQEEDFDFDVETKDSNNSNLIHE